MSRKVTFSDGRYWWVADEVADEIERLQRADLKRRLAEAAGPHPPTDEEIVERIREARRDPGPVSEGEDAR